MKSQLSNILPLFVILTGMTLAAPLTGVTECNCPVFGTRICGTDGSTYLNNCQANCRGISIAYSGPCVSSNGVLERPIPVSTAPLSFPSWFNLPNQNQAYIPSSSSSAEPAPAPAPAPVVAFVAVTETPTPTSSYTPTKTPCK